MIDKARVCSSSQHEDLSIEMGCRGGKNSGL
jgi:hypothetical protein